jgi:ABC-2 type transport system ATP-binding protein
MSCSARLSSLRLSSMDEDLHAPPVPWSQGNTLREARIATTTAPNATAAVASVVPLVVDSLVKRFGQIAAVDGISLELRAGECLGLLGPNGAGKSTLIRTIAGRVIPDAGRVAVFGHAAGSAAARAALGWVPQELALYPRLTAKENLRSFGRYNGMSGKALNDSVAWCLDWAALEDRAGELVRKLSGGMKRRLNMAAGLIHHPKLVLMDEPTVGVDPQSRNRIFEMIETLRAQGMTVIYTTHYMEEAERLCDRIAIVDHGRIIALDTRDALVRASFGDRSQVIARFAGQPEAVSAWAAARGGRMTDSTAEFGVEHPAEIAALLDSAVAAGLELVDLSLRRPNLESVFLHLTGRELRE